MSANSANDLILPAQNRTVHLNLKNFEEALTSYIKVLYFQPDNLKVLRPIAYCQFVLADLMRQKNPITRFFKEIQARLTWWMPVMSNSVSIKERSIKTLQQSKLDWLFSTNSFQSVFEEDIPYLIKNGISEEDLPLILDYLLFQVDWHA